MTTPCPHRPHKHLTLEELRSHKHLTGDEWFEELVARGILVGGDGPRTQIKPIKLLPPDALERFLEERG